MTTWWRSVGEGVKEQDIYSDETRSNGCQLVTALGVEPRILPEQKSQRKVIASPSFSYEWRHWFIIPHHLYAKLFPSWLLYQTEMVLDVVLGFN